MTYFPQLASGAISQYPVVRQNLTRTLSNVLEGGGSVRMADNAASQVAWELTYAGLSADEWSAIEQLFESVQGRLGSFVFLDPTANLLSWSEDYSQSVWSVDPLLQLNAGVQDPSGGVNATRLTNTAQASQRLVQHITGPAWYQYCFSVYLRSDAPATVSLVLSASSGEAMQGFKVSPQWGRFTHNARMAAKDDGIAFGIELAAGVQVDVFGFQVEPQPGAGKYKKTVDRSGVYVNCRFDVDSLTLSAQAPNQNSTVVRLISNLAAT